MTIETVKREEMELPYTEEKRCTICGVHGNSKRLEEVRFAVDACFPYVPQKDRNSVAVYRYVCFDCGVRINGIVKLFPLEVGK